MMAGLLLLGYMPSARPDAVEIQKLIAADRLDQALSLANRELARDKDNVTYRFMKGLILTRQEKLEQARDIFLGIVKSNPELPEPYNNLAVVYAAMGNFDQARQALEQAINTHPAYATAHENMGDIYAKLASQAYNQALELDRDNNAAKAKLSLVNELFSMPQTTQQPVILAGETPPAIRQQELAVQPPPQPVDKQAEEQAAAEREKLAKQQEAERLRKQQEQERLRQEQQQKLVAAVKQGVLDWAAAWSSRDVDVYLAAYAGDFMPADGMSLGNWRVSRQQRLSAAETITVTITDLVVEMVGNNRASATFTQVYQSDTYSDRVKKTLVMRLENNKWLITQEQTS
jgi:tetratricopeptide (TPR) repeat protein